MRNKYTDSLLVAKRQKTLVKKHLKKQENEILVDENWDSVLDENWFPIQSYQYKDGYTAKIWWIHVPKLKEIFYLFVSEMKTFQNLNEIERLNLFDMCELVWFESEKEEEKRKTIEFKLFDRSLKAYLILFNNLYTIKEAIKELD